MNQKLIRRQAVEVTTGLSRSSIYAMMSDNSFPRPIRIGKRAVAWREGDIAAWIEQRSAESRAS